MDKFKILTIGPDYRFLKGGIVSVLEVYAKNDKFFKFLPTYSFENNILNFLLFPFYYFRILIFLIINKSFKIIHIHGASQISFYRKYLFFIPIKYVLKRKVIYHIHGGAFHKFEEESSSFVKKRIHHFIDNSDAIICLSNNWKDYYLNGFNPKKVIILNNIINYPVKENTQFKQDIIKFLFLGKMVEEKGVFDILKCVGENKNYFLNKARIVLGGNGNSERIKLKINELKISEIVEFVGWVSGEKKEKLLLESDIFLLPSYYEGLPISILEAMSYKMPIIASDVGGISTIVKNKFNGFLINPGDNNDLFQGMKFFIENKEKIDENGQNSFNIVDAYLPENVIEDLHKIYESIYLV